MAISTELAWRLRYERGLRLLPNGEYENPRVGEIARRQEELMTELDALDAELDMLQREEEDAQQNVTRNP